MYVRIVLGLAIVAFGLYLALSPLVVADALDRPHATNVQMINLRASFGGTVMGIGAFIAWLSALRPWYRVLLGLGLWSMAGIGFARLIGFALDGDPDTRQFIWIVAEVALVIGCGYAVRRIKKR
jgi:uncharacterized protein DUF4345